MDGYAAQQREFDWLVQPSVMTRALRQLRVGCDAGLAVDVGCGTSSGMAAALREDLGARAVLCLDKEAAAIEFLRREGVNARLCDVADPDAGLGAVLEEQQHPALPDQLPRLQRRYMCAICPLVPPRMTSS